MQEVGWVSTNFTKSAENVQNCTFCTTQARKKHVFAHLWVALGALSGIGGHPLFVQICAFAVWAFWLELKLTNSEPLGHLTFFNTVLTLICTGGLKKSVSQRRQCLGRSARLFRKVAESFLVVSPHSVSNGSGHSQHGKPVRHKNPPKMGRKWQMAPGLKLLINGHTNGKMAKTGPNPSLGANFPIWWPLSQPLLSWGHFLFSFQFSWDVCAGPVSQSVNGHFHRSPGVLIA